MGRREDTAMNRMAREAAKEQKREIKEFVTGSTTSAAEFNFAADTIAVPLALPDSLKLRRVTCRAYHAVGTTTMSAAIYKVVSSTMVQPTVGVPKVREILDLVKIASALKSVSVPDTAAATLDFDFDEVLLDPASGDYVVVFQDSIGNTRFIVEGADWGYNTFVNGAGLVGLPNQIQVRSNGSVAGLVVLTARSLKGMNLLGR